MSTTGEISTIVRRLIGTLFVAESFFAAAQIAALTLMPVLAAELSARDVMAGYPHTAALLGQAGAAYVIGSLMDRVGRRAGLTLGYLVATMGAILAAAAVSWGSFGVFCVAAAMMGMGRGAGLQARFAAAEIEPPSRQARAIGIIVFAGTIGAIAGPLLVPLSQEWARLLGFNLRAGPYLVAAILFYCAVMVTFFLLRPDPMTLARGARSDADADSDADVPPNRTLRAIFAPTPVRLALASMLIGQLVMVLIMVITPLYMNRQAYTDTQIALVMTGHTLGMFGLAAITGWLIDKIGHIQMIGAGAVVLGVAGIMAPVAYSLVWLIAALFLLGLGWNFCFIAGSSLLSESLGEREKGRAQGTNDMLVALAAGVGSFSTGALFAAGGIVLIAMIGLSFSGALFISALWAGRQAAALPAGGD